MLPATSDAVLVAELGRVISAGWKLTERPKAVGCIPHLLQAAEPRPTESLSAVAARFLRTLDIALQEGSLAEDDMPLLTDEQSRGLRILFGTEPSYRDATAEVRRSNAADVLLGRMMKADSFYRSHETRYCRMALECLRARCGQLSIEKSKYYESVRRHSSAVIGASRRLSSVRISNTYRALQDSVSEIRTSFTVGPITAPLVQSISIVLLEGVQDYVLERRDVGDFRLRLKLATVAAFGALVPWSYERTYHYESDAASPRHGHVSTMARNPGYVASLDAQFLGSLPSLVWCFETKKTYIPGSPRLDALVTPDHAGQVFFPETEDTIENNVYGIAWQW